MSGDVLAVTGPLSLTALLIWLLFGPTWVHPARLIGRRPQDPFSAESGDPLDQHFRDRRLVLTRLHRTGTVSGLVVLVMFALVPAASADGEGETDVGYVLVQQALGHLAHDTSHEGMALAMEKVEDALATEDQGGVDVATLEEAKSALEAEQVETARTLLQASIKDALDKLPPATGEETGTTVIVPALDTARGLSGSDWAFIGVSLVSLLAGVLLSFRFRPADTVGELRRRMDGRR